MKRREFVYRTDEGIWRACVYEQCKATFSLAKDPNPPAAGTVLSFCVRAVTEGLSKKEDEREKGIGGRAAAFATSCGRDRQAG